MILRACFVALVVAVVSGCASLSESQCIASDWQTIGYADGAAGKSNSQLLRHQDACVKHGVVPDRAQYLIGWQEGVVGYCTPENGFAQGKRGAAYNNVCPQRLQDGFLDGYEQGRQIHLARAEINALESEKRSKENRLESIGKDIARLEHHLVNGDLTPAQRYEILDDTKALAREQGELSAEIERLTASIAVKRDRFQGMRQTLAYRN